MKTYRKNLTATLVAAGVALMTNGASPVLADDETTALWNKYCKACHGEDGKAQTKVGEKLGVRDLTDPAVRAAFDRARMVKALKEGVKAEDGEKLVMKGYAEKLTDDQIGSLLDFIDGLVE